MQNVVLLFRFFVSPVVVTGRSGVPVFPSYACGTGVEQSQGIGAVFGSRYNFHLNTAENDTDLRMNGLCAQTRPSPMLSVSLVPKRVQGLPK